MNIQKISRFTTKTVSINIYSSFAEFFLGILIVWTIWRLILHKWGILKIVHYLLIECIEPLSLFLDRWRTVFSSTYFSPETVNLSVSTMTWVEGMQDRSNYYEGKWDWSYYLLYQVPQYFLSNRSVRNQQNHPSYRSTLYRCPIRKLIHLWGQQCDRTEIKMLHCASPKFVSKSRYQILNWKIRPKFFELWKSKLTLCLSSPLGPITWSNICLPTWESTALSGSSNK